MVEYREIFSEEIKALIPYFVKFEEDNTILPTEYPDDCKVGGWGQQPIIMITHYENTFSANDSRQKVCTFERHRILCFKGKRRDIMVSDFVFL